MEIIIFIMLITLAAFPAFALFEQIKKVVKRWWKSRPKLEYNAEYDTWFGVSEENATPPIVMDASDINVVPGSLAESAENFRVAVGNLGGVTMQEAGDSFRRFGQAMASLGSDLKENGMTPHEKNWKIIQNSPHHYESWGLECPVVLIRKSMPSHESPGEYQAWCIAVYPMTHLKTFWITDPLSHRIMMDKLADWNYKTQECPCKEELDEMDKTKEYKPLKRKLDI